MSTCGAVVIVDVDGRPRVGGGVSDGAMCCQHSAGTAQACAPYESHAVWLENVKCIMCMVMGDDGGRRSARVTRRSDARGGTGTEENYYKAEIPKWHLGTREGYVAGSCARACTRGGAEANILAAGSRIDNAGNPDVAPTDRLCPDLPGRGGTRRVSCPSLGAARGPRQRVAARRRPKDGSTHTEAQSAPRHLSRPGALAHAWPTGM